MTPTKPFPVFHKLDSVGEAIGVHHALILTSNIAATVELELDDCHAFGSASRGASSCNS